MYIIFLILLCDLLYFVMQIWIVAFIDSKVYEQNLKKIKQKLTNAVLAFMANEANSVTQLILIWFSSYLQQMSLAILLHVDYSHHSVIIANGLCFF